MKNSLLVVIIIALIGAAYYLDQKEDVVDLAPNRLKGEKIFKIKLDDLREIHLPKTKLKNNKGKWLVTDLLYPVDRKLLGELVNRLNNIHVLKEIKVNEKVIDDFFKYQNHYIKLLSFEDNMEVRLGDVSQVTGHFYMQIYKNRQQKLYLCHDTTFFQGFYRTEEEANMQRYLGFKNLVLLTPKKLIEKKVLKDIDIDSLRKVSFEAISVEPFTMDIESNSTEPKTPAQIQKLNFRSSLKAIKENLFFEKFYERDDQILNKRISSTTFQFINKSKIEFELFGEMDKRNGYFLTITNDKTIYELDAKSISFFISQLSDFWLKKLLLPKTQFSGNDAFEIKLSQDNKKWYKFEVFDLKQFKIKSLQDNVTVNPEIQNFDQLFNLLFGQNQFKVATKLSVLDKKSKEELTKSGGVYIDIFGRKVFANKLNDIVYLLDLDKQLQYIYVKGAQDSIDFSTKHFFETKSK